MVEGGKIYKAPLEQLPGTVLAAWISALSMKKFLLGFLLGLAFVELGKSPSFPTLLGNSGEGREVKDPQVRGMMLFVLKKVKGEGEMEKGKCIRGGKSCDGSGNDACHPNPGMEGTTKRHRAGPAWARVWSTSLFPCHPVPSGMFIPSSCQP